MGEKSFFKENENILVFSGFGIKVTEGFSVISNVAVTIPIAINYSRAEFLFK